MQYEVAIPHCYVWMTAGSNNRKALFIKYVEGYISSSFPDLRLVRIQGMKAICERKIDS